MKAVLPPHFSVTQENNEMLLVIEIPNPIVPDGGSLNEAVFSEVARECDRIYFLTGVDLKPVLKRRESCEGAGTGYAYLGMKADLVASLKSDVLPQAWEERLERQLALWKLASSVPLSLKVNLLFQIIEAKYPETNNQRDYPPYLDDSVTPDPRTEALLLRHFVSHQKNTVMTQVNTQLGNYCRYIGVAEGFFNPKDLNHVRVVNSKVKLISDLAKQIINAAITRK